MTLLRLCDIGSLKISRIMVEIRVLRVDDGGGFCELPPQERLLCAWKFLAASGL